MEGNQCTFLGSYSIEFRYVRYSSDFSSQPPVGHTMVATGSTKRFPKLATFIRFLGILELRKFLRCVSGPRFISFFRAVFVRSISLV